MWKGFVMKYLVLSEAVRLCVCIYEFWAWGSRIVRLRIEYRNAADLPSEVEGRPKFSLSVELSTLSRIFVTAEMGPRSRVSQVTRTILEKAHCRQAHLRLRTKVRSNAALIFIVPFFFCSFATQYAVPRFLFITCIKHV